MSFFCPVGMWMQSTASFFVVGQSIRFNDDDSAYLSRTPSSSGSATDWTLSTWLKLGNLGTDRVILSAGTGGNHDWIQFQSNDTLRIVRSGSSILVSNQVFRDPSGWGNLVVESDIDNATASEKLKVYWNGSEITSWSTDTRSSYSSWVYFNQNVIHNIGRRSGSNDRYFDGYMAEIHFIDAVDPTSFGEFDANGVWVPIEYTGSYGTNGFRIDGADSADLGNDVSGNNNDFTTSGLTSADQMLDSPTDDAENDAENGVGNYCTWNPLFKGSNVSLADGNLSYDTSTNWQSVASTMSVSSGKFYWELQIGATAGAAAVGIIESPTVENILSQTDTCARDGWVHNQTGSSWDHSTTNTSPGGTWTNNDVVQVALDMDNGKIWWGANGSWFNSGDPAAGTNAEYTNLLSTARAGVSPGIDANTTASAIVANFGQSAFAHTPPTGFSALCTANLPAPGAGSTPLTSPSFTGNANADGPFVWLGWTPDTSGTSTINGNTITWGTHALPMAGGFKVITSSTSYNSTGTNTISIDVLTKSEGGAFGGDGVSQGKAR